MENLIGKARRKKLVSGFLGSLIFLLLLFNFSLLKHKFLIIEQYSQTLNFPYYYAYMIQCAMLLPFFSVVWYFDDCLRRECHSKALGGST